MADSENDPIEIFRKRTLGYARLIMRLRRACLCIVWLRANTPVDSRVIAVEVFLAAYDALIISYASCFAKSRDGLPKLEAKHVFKNKPELLEIHERAKLIRDSLVAHNGKNMAVDADVRVLPKDDFLQVEFAALLTLPSKKELRDLDHVIKHTYEYIDKKIKDCGNVLQNDIAKKVKISNSIGEVSPRSHRGGWLFKAFSKILRAFKETKAPR